MIEFRLPSLGSDMDEATLLQWLIEPGQKVKKGDVVAVVDTSKAAVDVEIWVDGTVHQVLTPIGQKIPVGTVMALVLAPGERAPLTGAAIERAPPAGAVDRPLAPTPPAAPVMPATSRAPAPAPPQPARTAAAAMAVPSEGVTRPRASPAARQRAAELGLAIESLLGTGPGGAITRDDVERAARPAAPPTPAQRALEMRKAIAAAMARSKREIPHYYLAEPVPMRAALDWLRAFNAGRPITQRVLPAALLLKAVALALREVPEMNGHFVDGVFHPVAQAHIGVAISLRQGGLVAPALHDVGAKPLPQLMAELADLVQRARAGSLRSSEMSDPTITVTNLGEQSVESVFGVIYPPQVALVGFGRLVERAWVSDGALVPMPLATASLAADHRVSDGHRGAVFLARLRDALQRPEQLQGE